MNLTDKDLDLIEAYRAGTIAEGAKAGLVRRLEEDQEFRRAVNEVVATLESLERIRDKVAFKKIKPKASSKIFRIQNLLKAAVISGVIITLGVVYWKSMDHGGGFSEKRTTYPSLEDKMIAFVEKEFKPYPALTEMQNQPEDPVENYRKGMYQEAILVWEKELYPASTAQDSIHLFYLSQCYLSINQPKKAIAILELMYQQHWPYAPKEIGWYLALAYIQNRQLIKAEPLLEKISKSDLMIRQKAKQALLLMQENDR